jgi:hypothetical protein
VATAILDVTDIIAATGWTGATVSNLTTSNDVRATDGTAGEVIKANVTDVPADFSSLNSVILRAEARVVGTVSRPKSLKLELRDSATFLLQQFTTGTLTSSDATYTSDTYTRSDSATVINGWQFWLEVAEGGGMADTATVEIDRMWLEIDYTASSSSRTGTLDKTLGAITSSSSAQLALKASLNTTLANFSLSSASKILLTGTLDKSIGTIGLVAEGSSAAAGVQGTLTASIGGISVAAAGAVLLQASLSKELGAITSSAAGAVLLTGALSKTLEPITLSAAGTVGQPSIQGTLASTIVNFGLSSEGKLAITAVMDKSVGDIILLGEANSLTPLTASLNTMLPDFISIAYGAPYTRDLTTIHERKRPRRNPLIRPWRTGW